MKHLLREYGFISMLVLVGAGAYFLYVSRGGDLVESSLDSIGARLERMVEKSEDQASVSDVFESFREKVRSGEVSPEQLERVEANILNMSRAGWHLAPDEAKILFEFEMAAPHADSMAVLLGAMLLGPPAAPHPHQVDTPVHAADPDDAPLKPTLNPEVLDKIRALREKGYRPPHNLDSLLEHLEADIRRTVDSALVRAEKAGRRTGD